MSLPYPAIVIRLRAAGCVFAEDEARLLIATAQTPAELTDMVDRRAGGLPLEHVLGWAEFCGLRVAVDPGVFVPRPRTEFLLRQATALAPTPSPLTPTPYVPIPTALAPPSSLTPTPYAPLPAAPAPSGERPVVAVDLCCGTGALGAALVAVLERVELHASDIDPAAVACARRNLTAAGGRVYEGDLYEPLSADLRGRIDLLLANVPYVPTGEIDLLPSEARLHEARVALDGGADGLDVLRRVTAEAGKWLAPGGHLLFETSERQVPQAVEAVTRHGLDARVTVSDEWDATVIIGTRP
jgi:release factor glutamine methyltransferase